MKRPSLWDGAVVVSRYSRAQALEDRLLVDVSESDACKELRYRFPVALTRAVWGACVEVPRRQDGSPAGCQDEIGRLWDVLYLAGLAVRRGGGDRVAFEVRALGPDCRRRVYRFVIVIGPGDTPEPVLTIGLPEDF